MNPKEMARTIRLMTFGCKSKDVMSCEFGNEFGDRVEAYLRECGVGDIETCTQKRDS